MGLSYAGITVMTIVISVVTLALGCVVAYKLGGE